VLHGAAHAGHHGPHHGNGSYSHNLSHAGSRIHYALRSILASVTGTHVPGEYGRDPLAAALAEEQAQSHMRSSYSASVLHASPALPAVGGKDPCFRAVALIG
jgi:hypothetical protein